MSKVSELNRALVIGCCVVSHWLLYLFVHRPDLPLYPGKSPLLGMGLWNSLPATLLLEGCIFPAGFLLYLRATKAKNRKKIFSLWGLMLFMVIIYFVNIMGTLPPGSRTIVWAGQLQGLFVLWVYRVDRDRISRQPGKRQAARIREEFRFLYRWLCPEHPLD